MQTGAYCCWPCAPCALHEHYCIYILTFFLIYIYIYYIYIYIYFFLPLPPHFEANGLEWVASAMQGLRPTMEDEHIGETSIDGHAGKSFFAVFDGHAGKKKHNLCFGQCVSHYSFFFFIILLNAYDVTCF